MDYINNVLDEIRLIHATLKKSHCLLAKALFLDFCGDIKKLSAKDQGAACELLWYEKSAEPGFGSDIFGYYWNNVEKRFELLW